MTFSGVSFAEELAMALGFEDSDIHLEERIQCSESEGRLVF